MHDSSETLLIGVDGGGTGCRVAVGTAKDGVLSEASGKTGNISVNFDAAIDNIRDAASRALDKIGRDVSAMQNARAHLGLAGVMNEEAGMQVANSLPFANAVVTSDRQTTLMAALDGRDGFLAAIGTGTFLASSRNGVQNFVGGWGFRVSDQASAAWLGNMAFNRALLSYDGVLEHSELTKMIMGKFKNDPARVANFTLDATSKEFGEYAPFVIEAAQTGDQIALGIIDAGVDYIIDGFKALGIKQSDLVVLGGGVGPLYESYLKKRLSNDISVQKNPTVYGAFKLALMAEQSAEGVLL